jgi:hypothetical protein
MYPRNAVLSKLADWDAKGIQFRENSIAKTRKSENTKEK